MNIRYFIEVVSMFFIPLLIVLAAIFIGQRYGMHRVKKSTELQPGQVGTAVGVTFGLLAFMLALTFQIVANRYDARKELLLEEVTNIRKTYLRAGLIPEPLRSDTRKLLVEYVDLRAELASDPSNLQLAKDESQQILNKLWSYSEKLGEQDRSSENYALFISSVNDLVDNYNQRITLALEYRLPSSILWVLFIITFISMSALGYQFGISGKGSFRINFLLAVVFSIVMFLILKLDRPGSGLAKVYQTPVLTLQHQLHENQLNGGNQ